MPGTPHPASERSPPFKYGVGCPSSASPFKFGSPACYSPPSKRACKGRRVCLVDPCDLTCPITGKLFRRACVVSTGQSYEQSGILVHTTRQADHGIQPACPNTGVLLDLDEEEDVLLLPNQTLQKLAREYAERVDVYVPPLQEAALLGDVDKALEGDAKYREALHALVEDCYTQDVALNKLEAVLRRAESGAQLAQLPADVKADTDAEELYGLLVQSVLRFPVFSLVKLLSAHASPALLTPADVKMWATLLGLDPEGDVDIVVENVLQDVLDYADLGQVAALLTVLATPSPPKLLMHAVCEAMELVSEEETGRTAAILLRQGKCTEAEHAAFCGSLARALTMLFSGGQRDAHIVGHLGELLVYMHDQRVALPARVMQVILLQPAGLFQPLFSAQYRAVKYHMAAMSSADWNFVYFTQYETGSLTEGSLGPYSLVEMLE